VSHFWLIKFVVVVVAVVVDLEVRLYALQTPLLFHDDDGLLCAADREVILLKSIFHHIAGNDICFCIPNVVTS